MAKYGTQDTTQASLNNSGFPHNLKKSTTASATLLQPKNLSNGVQYHAHIREILPKSKKRQNLIL
jgi:hypothetical protein